MEAEEAMARSHSVGVSPSVTTREEGADPGGMPLFVTMTVLTIVHHLAVIELIGSVYLPEDDTTLTGATETIPSCCTQHLPFSEIAVGHHCLAERALRGEGLPPSRSDNDQASFKQLDLQPQLAP
jgi:hypothetical protein